MADRKKMGEMGEDIACNYLISKGYKIIERNWRYEHYEIDLVALDHEELVIVEVKTRASAIYEEPEDSVTTKKIRFLINAAEAYLIQNDIDKETRFDIISIKWFSEEKQTIDHRINAFTPPVN